jgi:hypothetical protein
MTIHPEASQGKQHDMMPKIQTLGIRNITEVAITRQCHNIICILNCGHTHNCGSTVEPSTVRLVCNKAVYGESGSREAAT